MEGTCKFFCQVEKCQVQLGLLEKGMQTLGFFLCPRSCLCLCRPVGTPLREAWVPSGPHLDHSTKFDHLHAPCKFLADFMGGYRSRAGYAGLRVWRPVSVEGGRAPQACSGSTFCRETLEQK